MDRLPAAPSNPVGVAHVLVVEDDPIVRDFCVRLLRMKGYGVAAAEHGRAALTILDTQSFDLVITDLQMPLMGGIELLHNIRQRSIDLDVIVFTAYATVETAREALKLGAFDYLTKPVSVDDLERTVRRAIEWRRAQREKQRLSEIVAVYEISQAFTGTLDTAVAVRAIVALLSHHFSPKTLSLSLFHPEDEQLELLACISTDGIPPIGQRTILTSNPDEQRILVAHQKLASESTQPTPSHLFSMILRTSDRPVGVLRLTRASDRPGFEERERTLLTICASQIAASLDNSRLYHQQKEQYLQTIRAFAAVTDARDPYTRGHSEAVMRYAVRLAEDLKLDSTRVELIRYGALLHDIGKIGVRDEVLLKPGRLTEEEMAAMEAHPRIGADILRYIQALRPVIPMVEHHHERFDGHGYPRRLYGDEISPEARILAIADSFDAMTSERSYRRAMPLEQAIAELRRGRGSQWDADYIDTFIGLLEREGLEMLKKR
ncbi:MAG: response regulator [Roseiflexaceae bacterium]|nr:response regulator [Roseiflexaceae bacterium]